MTFELIALKKLHECPVNVRTIREKDDEIESAASIEVHGVLESLLVRPKPGKKGHFEVVDGERRRRGGLLLLERKVITGDYVFPCEVRDLTDEQARELSAVSNLHRRGMHPADEYVAFKQMVEDGTAFEEIARRFAVTPITVQRRLTLAAVSPKLFDLFKQDKITLSQLMAFTVCPDHARQEDVWAEAVNEWQREPYAIKERLTQKTLPLSDRLVKFIGIDAYVAAGGHVDRDLFDDGNTGFAVDVSLVERLANERLEREAEAVHAEKWQWIDTSSNVLYFHDFRRDYLMLAPEGVPLSQADAEEAERIEGELDEVRESYGSLDEMPPEVLAEWRANSARFQILTAPRWSDAQKTASGALLFIQADGSLGIQRGLKVRDGNGRENADATTQPNEKSVHGKSLVAALTAHRSAALGAALMASPKIALAAVVESLVAPLLARKGSCLTVRMSITVRPVSVSMVGNERDADADAFFDAIPADIRHGGDRAFYSPTDDFIQLPFFEAFESAAHYYGTKAHELAHWTKAESRLNRDFGRKRWGDEGYAAKELVAEMASCFLAAELGFVAETLDNHASYVQAWLKVLKNDKRAIFTAASYASKVADYLAAFAQDKQTKIAA